MFYEKKLKKRLVYIVYKMLRRSLELNKFSSNPNKREKHEEYQYINLVQDILAEGVMEFGRNGYAKTVVGSAMHFTLADGIIPFMTTKQFSWKTCAKELFWFISGSTDNKVLQDQNVKIWNGNASREYLDDIGFYTREENDLGPVYGHQWRHFNAPYGTCKDDYSGKGEDQLGYIISCLKNPHSRNSRRLILSAWNPCQLSEMALPPCHILVQFNVTDGDHLSCSMYQRSGDVGLGVPYNIASYSLLTHLIAHHCGLKATDFYYHLGNCHIYDDHIESLTEQIGRTPLPFPTIKINSPRENIEDYSLADIEISNYTSHGIVKMEMRK
jgi:thymidylate synthase